MNAHELVTEAQPTFEPLPEGPAPSSPLPYLPAVNVALIAYVGTQVGDHSAWLAVSAAYLGLEAAWRTRCGSV
jgi:hypothetical protein